MKIVGAIQETRAAVARLPRPLGLVPTMGYLHEGHLALVRAAKANDATVAVSIFVNPTQFGPNEDLSRYPRDMERDLALLRGEGVDLVFAPTPQEMYPDGHDTWVHVGTVTETLEGAARPGHFRGVATVVLGLFNVLQPDRAYFGQKDAQQTVVIRKMVRDLHVPVDVVVCPTIREPDGLAMSSRNVYLSADERTAALALSRALRRAEALYATGERDGERLRQAMRDVLGAEPLARPEYVSVADLGTLHEVERMAGPALASLAVRIGGTRLIDNVVLGGAG